MRLPMEATTRLLVLTTFRFPSRNSLHQHPILHQCYSASLVRLSNFHSLWDILENPPNLNPPVSANMRSSRRKPEPLPNNIPKCPRGLRVILHLCLVLSIMCIIMAPVNAVMTPYGVGGLSSVGLVNVLPRRRHFADVSSVFS